MDQPRAYREIETAYMLGYVQVDEWRKARRSGVVPNPALTKPDRWTEEQIRRELGMRITKDAKHAAQEIELDALLRCGSEP